MYNRYTKSVESYFGLITDRARSFNELEQFWVLRSIGNMGGYMKYKFLRLFCFLTAFTLFLSSCHFSGENHTGQVLFLKIENNYANCAIGDELTFTVKDDIGNTVDPSELLWESSDYSVATVNANGLIQCLSSGSSIITVTLKNDLTIKTTAEIFVGYSIEKPAFTRINRVGEYVDGKFGTLGDHALKYGFTIVSSAISSSLPIGILMEFFSKDKYQFSMMYYEGMLHDALIYSFSDWTNESVTIDSASLSPEKIHTAVLEGLIIDGAEMGKSYEDCYNEILALLAGKLPKDSTYHFEKMNPNLEYRVVIRADFNYFTHMSFYSNGLVTGFGLTIQDLLKLDFTSLRENYTYQKNFDEILDLSDLRICIEYREKAK